jgi:hypothetical protein
MGGKIISLNFYLRIYIFTMSANYICLVQCSRVIFLGDLNYRISLPEVTTRLVADREEWNALLENDQVYIQNREILHLYIQSFFNLI